MLDALIQSFSSTWTSDFRLVTRFSDEKEGDCLG